VQRVDAHPRLKARRGSGTRWPRSPGSIATTSATRSSSSSSWRARSTSGSPRSPRTRTLHLLREAPDPDLRGHRPRRRHDLDGATSPRQAARHAADRDADPEPAAPRREAPPNRHLRRRSRGERSLDLNRRGRPARPVSVQVDGSTSASTPSSTSPSIPVHSPSLPSCRDGAVKGQECFAEKRTLTLPGRRGPGPGSDRRRSPRPSSDSRSGRRSG
jgi:hypothetical protein